MMLGQWFPVASSVHTRDMVFISTPSYTDVSGTEHTPKGASSRAMPGNDETILWSERMLEHIPPVATLSRNADRWNCNSILFHRAKCVSPY